MSIDRPTLRHIDAVRRVMLEHDTATPLTIERTSQWQVRVMNGLVDIGDYLVEVEPVGSFHQDRTLKQIAKTHLLGLCEP